MASKWGQVNNTDGYNDDIASSFAEQTDPKTQLICVALFSVIWSIE